MSKALYSLLVSGSMAVTCDSTKQTPHVFSSSKGFSRVARSLLFIPIILRSPVSAVILLSVWAHEVYMSVLGLHSGNLCRSPCSFSFFFFFFDCSIVNLNVVLISSVNFKQSYSFLLFSYSVFFFRFKS